MIIELLLQIQNEKLGLIFKSRIELNENKLFVDNKYININSGMSVIAEEKTITV